MSGTRAIALPLLGTLAAALTGLFALAAAASAAECSPAAGPPSTADLDGANQLTLLSEQQVDPRLLQLTLQTPALNDPTGVRVLLPTGYASQPHRRYPVLYLLNGSLGSDTDWTELGNAEAATAGLPLIVVMPDGGEGGYYTDWYNNGRYGPPEWETYHIYELLPWIDAHFRTIVSRSGRAIAGLSMGGFGAFSYAARHPDLFVAAASFSGTVNTNEPPVWGEPDEALFDGVLPGDNTWGPRPTEEIYERAHNPWDLAENLSGLNLTMRTGNGMPGGPYLWDPVHGAVEAYVHIENLDMQSRLEQLHIPDTWQDYGPGDHTWPYWDRDLELTLPQLMAIFAQPPAPPDPVTFTAAEAGYEAYGWNVAVCRTAMEWSTLSNASGTGFELSGSGSATVTTPAVYGPGSRYSVTIAEQGHAPASILLKAGPTGRLTIPVPLGPANPYQEYTAQAALAGGTRVYTSAVRITPISSEGE